MEDFSQLIIFILKSTEICWALIVKDILRVRETAFLALNVIVSNLMIYNCLPVNNLNCFPWNDTLLEAVIACPLRVAVLWCQIRKGFSKVLFINPRKELIWIIHILRSQLNILLKKLHYPLSPEDCKTCWCDWLGLVFVELPHWWVFSCLLLQFNKLFAGTKIWPLVCCLAQST